MTVFLSGGCKNGKSTLAEQIAVHLSRPGRLYYLATMIPHDEEDRARIARHVESRAGLGSKRSNAACPWKRDFRMRTRRAATCWIASRPCSLTRCSARTGP